DWIINHSYSDYVVSDTLQSLALFITIGYTKIALMKRIPHIATKILHPLSPSIPNVLKMVKFIAYWPRMCILATCIVRLRALHGKANVQGGYMGGYDPHLVLFGLQP